MAFFSGSKRVYDAEIDSGINLEINEDYRWLTFKQIRELIKTSGIFAIEFRDAITLLLKYI